MGRKCCSGAFKVFRLFGYLLNDRLCLDILQTHSLDTCETSVLVGSRSAALSWCESRSQLEHCSCCTCQCR